jgi:hypothetical protein
MRAVIFAAIIAVLGLAWWSGSDATGTRGTDFLVGVCDPQTQRIAASCPRTD